MLQKGHSKRIDRQASFAGSFYPARPDNLQGAVNEYIEHHRKATECKRVRALISPHAGYIYSGSVAGAAFACLDPSVPYKRIFIIGSSHRHSYKGAALYTEGDFITPLGRVKVDSDTVDKLIAVNRLFSSYPLAHNEEHGLEVQLPFLQHIYGDKLLIVPILLGTADTDQISIMAEELRPWFTPDNLFIISSDFSHYPEYKEALKLDALSLDKLFSTTPGEFAAWINSSEKKQIHGALTPMCGWTSCLLLKYLAEGKNNLAYSHLDYANSGDSKHGNREGVVGYHAIALCEKDPGFHGLSIKDRVTLLKLARDNIRSRLYAGCFIKVNKEDFSLPLRNTLGAFVTLRSGTKLRGCIGRLTATEPLYETIRQMSAAAAFNDSRFDPLTREELDDIKIEISVLSKMKKIESVEEIEPGRHGVYLKRGTITATFLPQVAKEQKWNREELLGNLSKNKAGLGLLGWKDADIYIYEAVIFEEER